MELGNHSEFLDVMSRNEMLAMYFVHDGGETAKWRLKGHGKNLDCDDVILHRNRPKWVRAAMVRSSTPAAPLTSLQTRFSSLPEGLE
jgi:hypothetical protein